NTPSKMEAITIKGVSLLRRKIPARRPARPVCPSEAICHSDRIAVAQSAGRVDDLVPSPQSGANLDRFFGVVAHGQPAELGAIGADQEHALQIAALDDRRPR